MKISICLCIRNGEKYMMYLDKLCNDIEQKYKDFEFEYYIYENNSTDNTKNLIEKFGKTKKCRYLLEDIPNNNIHSGIESDRGKHMASIRNKLKDFHGELDSDYTLLIDCDVVFLPNTIEKLIKSFDDKISMVSTFCICWETYKNYKIIHYYDSFALISDNNISYKENENTCLFKLCERCLTFRKFLNIDIHNLFDYDKIIQVKSAFGSLSMIKTEIYNKVRWNSSVCEHHSFCEQVNKYGNIIINPNIKIYVTQPDMNDYDDIKKHLRPI